MDVNARCTAQFGDQISEGTLLLETDALVFRGEFWLSIPLKTIEAVEVQEGRLAVSFPRGVVTFHLGALADEWALKIRPPVARRRRR